MIDFKPANKTDLTPVSILNTQVQKIVAIWGRYGQDLISVHAAPEFDGKKGHTGTHFVVRINPKRDERVLLADVLISVEPWDEVREVERNEVVLR